VSLEVWVRIPLVLRDHGEGGDRVLPVPRDQLGGGLVDPLVQGAAVLGQLGLGAGEAPDRVGHGLLLAVSLLLVLFLLAPLFMILAQSVEDKEGAFAGLANFTSYLQTPALARSLWNSVWVSVVVWATELNRSVLLVKPVVAGRFTALFTIAFVQLLRSVKVALRRVLVYVHVIA